MKPSFISFFFIEAIMLPSYIGKGIELMLDKSKIHFNILLLFNSFIASIFSSPRNINNDFTPFSDDSSSSSLLKTSLTITSKLSESYFVNNFCTPVSTQSVAFLKDL